MLFVIKPLNNFLFKEEFKWVCGDEDDDEMDEDDDFCCFTVVLTSGSLSFWFLYLPLTIPDHKSEES